MIELIPRWQWAWEDEKVTKPFVVIEKDMKLLKSYSFSRFNARRSRSPLLFDPWNLNFQTKKNAEISEKFFDESVRITNFVQFRKNPSSSHGISRNIPKFRRIKILKLARKFHESWPFAKFQNRAESWKLRNWLKGEKKRKKKGKMSNKHGNQFRQRHKQIFVQPRSPGWVRRSDYVRFWERCSTMVPRLVPSVATKASGGPGPRGY